MSRFIEVHQISNNDPSSVNIDHIMVIDACTQGAGERPYSELILATGRTLTVFETREEVLRLIAAADIFALLDPGPTPDLQPGEVLLRAEDGHE